MSTGLIALQGVGVRYGATTALQGVDFTLHAGERVALRITPQLTEPSLPLIPRMPVPTCSIPA